MASRNIVLALILSMSIGCGDELRLNDAQTRGTEYSHVASDRLFAVDGLSAPFTHHPLEVQMAADGVRQLDLSVSYSFEDLTLLARQGVLRDIDYDLTQCDLLAECMRRIATWSRSHRQHYPLIVMIQANGHDNISTRMNEVEDIIRRLFERWQIITPAEVTAGYPDLRTALAERGWPAIELSRGRTMFVLNDRGRTREAYLAGRFLDPDEPRLLFTVADNPDVPYAGIFSFPDVTAANQGQIRALVEQGYLVRAITNTEDAVQRAIDNGVHFLSTRYPDDLLPPDRLGGFPSGCNPVTTDETCEPSMIELPPR